jgi:hypothetical protein
VSLLVLLPLLDRVEDESVKQYELFIPLHYVFFSDKKPYDQCPQCHHTAFHTVAYEYADAEALVVRLKARRDRTHIPEPALNAPLRPATQPVEHPGEEGQIYCANSHCFTKSRGTRTRGSRACNDYFCAHCCKNARLAAISSNTARPKCVNHKVAAVTPTVLGVPSQATSAPPMHREVAQAASGHPLVSINPALLPNNALSQSTPASM